MCDAGDMLLLRVMVVVMVTSSRMHVGRAHLHHSLCTASQLPTSSCDCHKGMQQCLQNQLP